MADFKIKITTDGGKSAADEIKKVGDATGQAAQKIGQSAEITEKAAKSKHKLIDAFKKLKHEVPLVGAAVDTLKNPIAAVTIATAAAVNMFRQFSEQVEALATIIGDGKLADQFGNIRTALAAAAIDGNKFRDALAAIQGRAESVNEQVARLNETMERSLKVEAARDEMAKGAELAGVNDPEVKAGIEAKFAARGKQRDQRRLAGQANALAQAQFRAQDIVREGVAALPGAQADLAAAQIRRDQLFATADAQTVDVGALQKQLASDESGRFLGGFRDFLNPAGKKQRGQRDADLLESARINNANAATLRLNANAEFEGARQHFDELQGRTLGAAEDVRKFSRARGAAVADAAAFQQFNDPGAAALVARTRQVQAIFDEFLRRIALMTNDRQQQVDSISRANAHQAQQ